MALLEGMLRLNQALRGAIAGGEGVEHRLSRGEFRENELQDALRPHIPLRFEMSGGEVVNSAGATSEQQDLLVTDSYSATPFLSSGRIGVHPIETVFASLQVKSRVDATSVVDAVNNVASVKALLPTNPWPVSRLDEGVLTLGETWSSPFTGIVAFTLHGNRESVFAAYLNANLALERRQRVDALLVLDQFVIYWLAARTRAETGKPVATVPEAAGSLAPMEQGERSILTFYVLLMQRLRLHTPPPLDLVQYLNAVSTPHKATVQLVEDR